MKNMEPVYLTVQHEADETNDFGLRELAGILLVTLGIGLILTIIGVAL